MSQNALFDTLGVLIGFVGVMLILSLLVTALTQAVVGLVGIRARNLRFGLDRLLEQAAKTKPQAGQDAAAAPKAADVLKTNKLTEKGLLSTTTWVLSDELGRLLKESHLLGEEQIKAAQTWFPHMERALSQRFQAITRLITFGCAFLVAVVFQVSSPDLLTRLSTDARFRESAVAAAEQLAAKYGVEDPRSWKYEDVSEKALEQLQQRHPDLAAQLEEVSGVGRTLDDVLAEMTLVFEKSPQRNALVAEYKTLLDELDEQRVRRAQEQAREIGNQLALLNISPFSGGWKYYASASHVLGILVTMVLISLGAPLWFNTLSWLMSLRDFMAPQKGKRKSGQDALAGVVDA